MAAPFTARTLPTTTQSETEHQWGSNSATINRDWGPPGPSGRVPTYNRLTTTDVNIKPKYNVRGVMGILTLPNRAPPRTVRLQSKDPKPIGWRAPSVPSRGPSMNPATGKPFYTEVTRQSLQQADYERSLQARYEAAYTSARSSDPFVSAGGRRLIEELDKENARRYANLSRGVDGVNNPVTHTRLGIHDALNASLLPGTPAAQRTLGTFTSNRSQIGRTATRATQMLQAAQTAYEQSDADRNSIFEARPPGFQQDNTRRILQFAGVDDSPDGAPAAAAAAARLNAPKSIMRTTQPRADITQANDVGSRPTAGAKEIYNLDLAQQKQAAFDGKQIPVAPPVPTMPQGFYRSGDPVKDQQMQMIKELLADKGIKDNPNWLEFQPPFVAAPDTDPNLSRANEKFSQVSDTNLSRANEKFRQMWSEDLDPVGDTQYTPARIRPSRVRAQNIDFALWGEYPTWIPLGYDRKDFERIYDLKGELAGLSDAYKVKTLADYGIYRYGDQPTDVPAPEFGAAGPPVLEGKYEDDDRTREDPTEAKAEAPPDEQSDTKASRPQLRLHFSAPDDDEFADGPFRIEDIASPPAPAALASVPDNPPLAAQTPISSAPNTPKKPTSSNSKIFQASAEKERQRGLNFTLNLAPVTMASLPPATGQVGQPDSAARLDFGGYQAPPSPRSGPTTEEFNDIVQASKEVYNIIQQFQKTHSTSLANELTARGVTFADASEFVNASTDLIDTQILRDINGYRGHINNWSSFVQGVIDGQGRRLFELAGNVFEQSRTAYAPERATNLRHLMIQAYMSRWANLAQTLVRADPEFPLLSQRTTPPRALDAVISPPVAKKRKVATPPDDPDKTLSSQGTSIGQAWTPDASPVRTGPDTFSPIPDPSPFKVPSIPTTPTPKDVTAAAVQRQLASTPVVFSPAAPASNFDLRTSVPLPDLDTFRGAVGPLVGADTWRSLGILGSKKDWNAGMSQLSKSLRSGVVESLKNMNRFIPKTAKTPLKNVTNASIVSALLSKPNEVKAIAAEQGISPDKKRSQLSNLAASEIKTKHETTPTPARAPSTQRLAGTSTRKRALKTPAVAASVAKNMDELTQSNGRLATLQPGFVQVLTTAVDNGAIKLTDQVLRKAMPFRSASPSKDIKQFNADVKVTLSDRGIQGALKTLVLAKRGVKPSENQVQDIVSLLSALPGLYPSMRNGSIADDVGHEDLKAYEEITGKFTSSLFRSLKAAAGRSEAISAVAQQNNQEGYMLLQASAESIATHLDSEPNKKSIDPEKVMLACVILNGINASTFVGKKPDRRAVSVLGATEDKLKQAENLYDACARRLQNARDFNTTQGTVLSLELAAAEYQQAEHDQVVRDQAGFVDTETPQDVSPNKALPAASVAREDAQMGAMPPIPEEPTNRSNLSVNNPSQVPSARSSPASPIPRRRQPNLDTVSMVLTPARSSVPQTFTGDFLSPIALPSASDRPDVSPNRTLDQIQRQLNEVHQLSDSIDRMKSGAERVLANYDAANAAIGRARRVRVEQDVLQPNRQLVPDSSIGVTTRAGARRVLSRYAVAEQPVVRQSARLATEAQQALANRLSKPKGTPSRKRKGQGGTGEEEQLPIMSGRPVEVNPVNLPSKEAVAVLGTHELPIYDRNEAKASTISMSNMFTRKAYYPNKQHHGTLVEKQTVQLGPASDPDTRFNAKRKIRPHLGWSAIDDGPASKMARRF